MEQKVFLSTQNRRKLKEQFQCSNATISDSLNYRNNSLAGRRIRMYAINHLHGILIDGFKIFNNKRHG